jgi:cold shock CspA family protein/ribosome-associated translation inhibitor RaiA
MQIPVRVTFAEIAPSAALEEYIRERAASLERFYSRITGCRVHIRMPHRRQQAGRRFEVRIDITVPGEEIAVTHAPTLHGALQDVAADRLTKQAEVDAVHKFARVAVREAFAEARRRLQAYAERQRGEVKSHEPPAQGEVRRLSRDGNAGFILTSDGREIYFHRNSVLRNGFDRLREGSRVTFVEEAGERGPQASTVRPAGRRRAAMART